MALSTWHSSNDLLQAQGDAQVTKMNGGFMKRMSGLMPATPQTAITTQVVLSSLGLGNPSAVNVNGVITLNAVAALAIIAAGVYNWFRIYKSDGVTPVGDGVACNQVITLTAAILAADIVMHVQALAQPLYKGQVVYFDDGTGTLKPITVDTVGGVDGAQPTALTVPILAPGFGVGNGAVNKFNDTVNSPNFQFNALSGITSCVFTLPVTGS